MSGARPTWGLRRPAPSPRLAWPAALAALVFASSCASFEKPEPARSSGPGPAVEAPPPRTALSDGAYCLLPNDSGFQQVSCATGAPFPQGSILADGSKVCFEIDKGTRKLLPIPCGGPPPLATAPTMRAPSILPPPPRPVEKPIATSGKWCTYETSDGLRMLAECGKMKSKAPPKAEALRLCERLVDGIRYVVPCD